VDHSHPMFPLEWIPKLTTELRSGVRPNNRLNRVFEFILLTACRSGEARRARWKEIDWENRIWTIPLEHLKTKRTRKRGTPHRVPLSTYALTVLRAMLAHEAGPDSPIFPSNVARSKDGLSLRLDS
jgi:integrase